MVNRAPSTDFKQTIPLNGIDYYCMVLGLVALAIAYPGSFSWTLCIAFFSLSDFGPWAYLGIWDSLWPTYYHLVYWKRVTTRRYSGSEVMAKVVEAVYENGVLKPLEKLDLREGQRVRIRIIEKDVIQVAREIRNRLRGRLGGRDLVEDLIKERERFA